MSYMEKEAAKFCNRLGIEYTKDFLLYYKKGMVLLSKHGTKITDTQRLCALNEKYNIFRKWFSDVCKAAQEVEKDRDLLAFTYMLYCMICEDSPLVKMKMPDRARIDTDFAPLFSFLFCLEDMIENMEKRGLPHDIITDTLQGFDAEINDYFDMFGRSGMRIYAEWFMLFAKCKIVRVGRLNFEMTELKEKVRVYKKGDDIKIMIDGQDMHEKGMLFGSLGQSDAEGKFFAKITQKGDEIRGYCANEYGECEKEEISLIGYTEILRHGDKILSVHIPAHEKFSPEICRTSYKRADEIFKKYYPEHKFKAYCSFSWMLEPRLRDILGRDTNITRFCEDYLAFPMLSDGSEVYTFLFHKEKPCAPQDLPENSSMQRAVKKHLCSGGYFYQKGGILKIDENLGG